MLIAVSREAEFKVMINLHNEPNKNLLYLDNSKNIYL